MKIVHIVPGSGGSFYCQNCLRDGVLVKSLRALGHDVVMVPMYLPLGTDGKMPGGHAPVFFGAVNVYLREKLPLFRRVPHRLQRLLDAPALLRWAATKAGSTRARGLEGMTLSMLRGEQGNQTRELASLVAWLNAEGRPDVVHLSNALLLGLARPIRRELGVPVVCTLQDEHVWLDAMAPLAAEQAWTLMRDIGKDVGAFIAVSKYYAGLMQERLAIPADRLHVVPVGIDTEGYKRSPLPFNPPVLGFLSRLSEPQGFDILVDAFLKLKSMEGLGSVRLRATGGATGDNSGFLRRIRKRLARAGWLDHVEFLDEFDRAKRLEFLASLTVLSVPVPGGEAFGTFQLEAMAAGVPVVQPRLGGFPEVVENTGGGILYEPNSADALAEALRNLLCDRERLRELGSRGRRAVLEGYTASRMARDMFDVYQAII